MTASDAGTKRQARGQRRIEQILRAAAEIFAERGYEAATTNAIAAAAGISPGSLYQFFSSKEDIAHGLAMLYAEQLGRIRADAFGDATPTDSPLPAIIDGIIDPVIAFNLANPGFKALFARTDMPAALSQAVAPIHTAIHGRVTELILAAIAGMTRERAEHATIVVVQLVRAMMPLITGSEGDQREAYATDLKSILASYLERS